MPDTFDESIRRSEPESESELRLFGPRVPVAPSAHDTSEANVVVLFPVPLEFLCVQLTFHRVPMVDLKVRFLTLDGALVEDGLRTSGHGKVGPARRVPMGAYICEVEHQEPVRVYTVPSPEQSFPVTLPVGRFYRDLRERDELPTAHAKSRRVRAQSTK